MGEVAQLSHARRRAGSFARTHAYAAVHDAIVRCEFAPGRRLSENEVASWLGISRTPVREAFARLREDQLVEIVAQLGTFVAPISERAVHDAQFVREALECSAVRLAAERASDDDILALGENLRSQERARTEGDHNAFYLLDDEFHHALCDLSGHATVWAISQRAKSHLNRVRRLSLPVPNYLAAMIAEHEQIVEAIARHDAEAAEAEMRHHLRMVLREVPRIRDQHPEYFEER